MKVQSSSKMVFPWKIILFSSAAILASINNTIAQNWSEWQVLDKTNNLIDISFSITKKTGDVLGSTDRRKFNFRLHNRGSGTVTVNMKITTSTDNREEATPMIWRDIKGLETLSDDMHYVVATSLVRVDVTEMTFATPKLGDFQKELTFPDAIDGKWISFDSRYIDCPTANLTTVTGTLQLSFQSRGDGSTYTVQFSDLKTTGPQQVWTKKGNTLTHPYGVYTYSLSNNIFTMTQDAQDGCKLQWKFKRND